VIPLGCVTGRFQPVHEQHFELFEIALEACDHLIVAVTNPDTDARGQEPASAHRHLASANPFNYFERVCLLKAALQARGRAERTTIVPFDLTRPGVWPQYVPLSARQYVRAFSDWERQKAQRLEKAGYAVTVLEGDSSSRMSASAIRSAMRSGDGRWRRAVPAPTLPLLDDLLRRTPIGERG
jgi:nicotinamide-nucleotide adenylyltransferase